MDPVTLALAKSWAEGQFGDLRELSPHIEPILDSRIVEMGSNSNGEYVRWENGLQVCLGRIVASVSEDTLWTLPAAFIDSEWVFSSGTGAPFNDGVRIVTFEGRTPHSVSLRVLNASGARVAGTVFIIAIGRWK